ncbi:ferrous iron transporter B [Guggenheimella bovis]
MRIALAGNPNSGKTTLYNRLTGRTEQVGNWSGVTVEQISAPYQKDQTIEIIDLPGAFSMSSKSLDEQVAANAIHKKDFDVLINIIDGANLERSLFFTTEILELGIPTVIAVNKMDILEKRGDELDFLTFSQGLHAPVVEIEAERGKGLDALIEEAKRIDTKPVKKLEVGERRDFIQSLLEKSLTAKRESVGLSFSDELDRIFIHPILGIVCFFLIMWAVYAISVGTVGTFMSDLIQEYLIDGFLLQGIHHIPGLDPLIMQFFEHVVVGGVGSIISFIPLIMLLFFLLSLLEDSGYMARVAVLMEKWFRSFGLSGKSIIPMIVGSGCAVPGVMATRTIENANQRRITALLTPFVPCSAKLPVIGLISVSFFPKSSWVAPSIYILAVFIIVISGHLVKKIYPTKGAKPFIVELPDYRFPNVRQAVRRMLGQAKSFLYKASTVIFVSSGIIWVLMTFTPTLSVADRMEHSLLAFLTRHLAFVLYPMGLESWKLLAGAVTGFIAKENVVSSLAVLLGAGSAKTGLVATGMNAVLGYSFLAFNLFTPPCIAAMAAMKNELQSPSWFRTSLIFQFSVGYITSIVISQVGSILFYGTVLPSLPAAIVILLGYAILISYKIRRAQ